MKIVPNAGVNGKLERSAFGVFCTLVVLYWYLRPQAFHGLRVAKTYDEKLLHLSARFGYSPHYQIGIHNIIIGIEAQTDPALVGRVQLEGQQIAFIGPLYLHPFNHKVVGSRRRRYR